MFTDIEPEGIYTHCTHKCMCTCNNLLPYFEKFGRIIQINMQPFQSIHAQLKLMVYGAIVLAYPRALGQ